MSDVVKVVAAIVLAVATICVLDYTGLMWESFMGPKRENVRREIYESTRSFNEGKRQDLIKYYYEYQKADEAGKAGMPAIHNFQEKKLLKMILELRDQENLATWVYLQSSYTGKN